MIIKQIFNYPKKAIRSLCDLISINSQEASVFQYFNNKQKNTFRAKKIILVESVEDICYFGLFGQIISSLREQQDIRVEQFVFRSLNVEDTKSIWIFIKNRFIIGPLLSSKWTKLYKSFCDGIAFRSTSFQPFNDFVDFFRAISKWKKLKNKKELIDLYCNDILVGDLVNDSYLRFKPAGTVNLKDPYLVLVLWQAFRDIRRAKKYFSQIKPKIFLTSYTTYIQHGVASRVALKLGVHVFSFGNYQEFAKKLTISDWVHTKNPDFYSGEFSKLNNKDEELKIAENALSLRMIGVLDNATAYMKKSAYAISNEPVPNVNGAVIIFLHDFFDSPHVYRNMVFPDFWEWVCFTIDVLKKEDIPFFIKPHPNQIGLSDKVLAELRHRYFDLKEISPSITNKQLVEGGMVCAITVHGTVAHEMAFLGVPTIACGHNPHSSFDICVTAINEKEYAQHLKNSREIKINKANLREQSLRFYYMHNLSMGNIEKSLIKSYLDFRRICDQNEKDVIVEALKKIAIQPGYMVYIEKWRNILFD